MILSWPLCTSDELASTLRPGGHIRPDSALRTLRDRAVPAEPITVVPRSGRRAHGRSVWYSALMLDVARLVRIGDVERAAELHREATRIADQRAIHFVAEWLVEHSGARLDLAKLDSECGGALTRVATLTMSTRQQLLPDEHAQSILGIVETSTGREITLVDNAGARHSIPVADNVTTRYPPGKAVAIDIDALDAGSVTIRVRPAFVADRDPNTRVPGSPHLLRSDERTRTAHPLTSAR